MFFCSVPVPKTAASSTVRVVDGAAQRVLKGGSHAGGAEEETLVAQNQKAETHKNFSFSIAEDGNL